MSELKKVRQLAIDAVVVIVTHYRLFENVTSDLKNLCGGLLMYFCGTSGAFPACGVSTTLTGASSRSPSWAATFVASAVLEGLANPTSTLFLFPSLNRTTELTEDAISSTTRIFSSRPDR